MPRERITISSTRSRSVAEIFRDHPKWHIKGAPDSGRVQVTKESDVTEPDSEIIRKAADAEAEVAKLAREMVQRGGAPTLEIARTRVYKNAPHLRDAVTAPKRIEYEKRLRGPQEPCKTAAFISERRKALNVSQAELAKTVNADRSTLHRFESGETQSIGSRVCHDIFKALAVTTDDLRDAGILG